MSDLSKAKPSNNYDLLRKQFSSLKMLAVSQENTISLLSKKDNSLAQIRLDKLHAGLTSEKEMNAFLTTENEKLVEQLASATVNAFRSAANTIDEDESPTHNKIKNDLFFFADQLAGKG